MNDQVCQNILFCFTIPSSFQIKVSLCTNYIINSWYAYWASGSLYEFTDTGIYIGRAVNRVTKSHKILMFASRKGTKQNCSIAKLNCTRSSDQSSEQWVLLSLDGEVLFDNCHLFGRPRNITGLKRPTCSLVTLHFLSVISYLW